MSALTFPVIVFLLVLNFLKCYITFSGVRTNVSSSEESDLPQNTEPPTLSTPTLPTPTLPTPTLPIVELQKVEEEEDEEGEAAKEEEEEEDKTAEEDVPTKQEELKSENSDWLDGSSFDPYEGEFLSALQHLIENSLTVK